MSRSGVRVQPECTTAFDELKLGKKFKYIIYGLTNGNTEIEVVKAAPAAGSSEEEAYEDFMAQFPENGCLWAIYDFAFKTAEGAPRNKIVFYAWSPDGAPIKAKMVSASSKESLRKSMSGIAVEVQGTDFDEVSFDTVLEKCMKGR
uniref:Cofilin n=1 Tax=Dactylellina haptotyla TaxID=430498 RepID=Q5USA9_9PEZI|nr:cofilin-like protein [Dactylellina haptotyla]